MERLLDFPCLRYEWMYKSMLQNQDSGNLQPGLEVTCSMSADMEERIQGCEEMAQPQFWNENRPEVTQVVDLVEAVVQGSWLHWEDDITRTRLHKSFIKKLNLCLSIYLITAFPGWRKLLLDSTSACYLQSMKI